MHGESVLEAVAVHATLYCLSAKISSSLQLLLVLYTVCIQCSLNLKRQLHMTTTLVNWLKPL